MATNEELEQRIDALQLQVDGLARLSELRSGRIERLEKQVDVNVGANTRMNEELEHRIYNLDQCNELLVERIDELEGCVSALQSFQINLYHDTLKKLDKAHNALCDVVDAIESWNRFGWRKLKQTGENNANRK